MEVIVVLLATSLLPQVDLCSLCDTFVGPLIFPFHRKSGEKVFLTTALPSSLPACIIEKDRNDSCNEVKSSPSEGIYFLITLSDVMQLSFLTPLFALKFHFSSQN